MAPKKKQRPDGPQWEWYSDDGEWTAFPAEDIAAIEKVYVTGAKELVTSDLSFNKGYATKYTFNFKDLIQINNDSKKTRKIRRVAPTTECSWEWKDDAGLFVQFYDEDNAEIERMYLTNGLNGAACKTKKLSFNKGYDSTYTFVFTKIENAEGSGTPIVRGEQKNLDSGTTRELRRIQKKLPWTVEGYGTSGAKLPTVAEVAAVMAAVTAPVAAPVAATTTAVAPPGGSASSAPPAPSPLTKHSTLSVPAHWTEKGCHVFDCVGTHGTPKVAPGSEEYKLIEGAFLSSIGKDVKVIQITRIENVTLWTFYAMNRAQISKKNGGNENEKMLFFGERIASNRSTICKFGFDTRVAESGAFGIGLYFGVKAAYCDSGRCLQNADKTKEVFVCRASLGDVAKGANGFRRPPPKDPKKPTMELFDSCHDSDPATLYVLFNNSQAYPEYIVKYL